MKALIEKIRNKYPNNPIVEACFFAFYHGMYEDESIEMLISTLINSSEDLRKSYFEHLQRCGHIDPILLDFRRWSPEKIQQTIEEFQKAKKLS